MNTIISEITENAKNNITKLKEKNQQLEKLLQELQAAQVLLQKSESRFRSVAQSAHDAIITADSNGCITFWNRRAEKMFGYSEQEVLNQPLTMLMPERFREAHNTGMMRFLATGQRRIIGQVVEIEAKRKDGTEFPIELTVSSWETEEGKFVTGIIRDITKRKQEQEALQRMQATLEAENRRKTVELEKARELQLSLLPKELPQLPHIEIDTYMKTATEVGGDYYDIQSGEDGMFKVLLGDATGHGLNAGMMVTATKSVFTTLDDETDVVTLFKQMNRALHRLNLSRQFMALLLIKIQDYHLEVCSAGMPPVLIYRSATKEVEDVVLKAMPLGGVADFPYEKRELVLSPGDTILLMTDGFAERFNPKGEIFDYDRVKHTFAEIGHQSPGRIIEHFLGIGEAWAAGRPQDDDMTFVVLKVK